MAVFTIQNVPDTLKKQFKATCIENGESMAKATINMMIDYIAESYQNKTEEVQQISQAEEMLNTLGLEESQEDNNDAST